MPGRATKWTPARCSEELLIKIEHVCQDVMKALDFCTLGRIDGFLTPNGDIIIIDPNSLSGLAPSSFAFVQAAQKKLNHAKFIQQLLETEMKKNQSINKDTEPLLEHMNHKVTREPHKTIVAVIFGGASHEREISLESGRNVIYKLPLDTYQVLPIFLSEQLTLHMVTHEQLVLNSTQEIQACLEKSQRWTLEDLQNNVDFVFIALHGGHGEDGSLQGALEMLQIPYNGSGVLASALCMDKYKTTQFLKSCGFNTPRNVLVPLQEQHSDFSVPPFPLIIKPHNDGCSVGVHKVENDAQLQAAITLLKNNGFEYALIEEFIQGMELTVGVLGNSNVQALPPSATIATQSILSIEEKFLPGAGENQTPAPLSAASLELVQREIENIYKAIGCSGYARLDCFYQSEKISPTGKECVVLLEVNSLPGLTPATVIFHQAAEVGMSPGDFLHKIIELGFEKHGKPKHLTTRTAETSENEIALA